MNVASTDIEGGYDFDGVSQTSDYKVVIASAKPRVETKNAHATSAGLTAEKRVNIGIAVHDREKIAEGLSKMLADTYTLYLMTHNFHWNVTGPQFRSLHLFFEEQYLELAVAVDLVAERIRALGLPAPATFSEFMRLTSINEREGVPAAADMVQLLCDGQEAVIRTARSILPIAETFHDYPTVDLLTQRMQSHEKAAWMLRSLQE